VYAQQPPSRGSTSIFDDTNGLPSRQSISRYTRAIPRPTPAKFGLCATTKHVGGQTPARRKPTDDRYNRCNVLFTLWREDQAVGLQNLTPPFAAHSPRILIRGE